VVAATASRNIPFTDRQCCRRVNGRSIRAWALSTLSETPRCSDQLNESIATHATVEVAIAVLLKGTFMDFLPLQSSLADCTGTRKPLARGLAISHHFAGITALNAAAPVGVMQ
jgi:hypothetical protein